MAAAAILAAQFIMIWCGNLAVRVDDIVLAGDDLRMDQEAAEVENQIKRESGRVEHEEEADEETARVDDDGEHQIAGSAEREDEAQQQESGEVEHQKTEEVEVGSEFKGFVNKTIEEFDDFEGQLLAEASKGDPCALALHARNFAGTKLSVTQTSTLYGGNLKFTYDIVIGKSILQKAPDRHYNVGNHHSYDGMTEYFKKGTHCGRHGHREAKIAYSFGASTKLLLAKEPSTCRYEYKVQLKCPCLGLTAKHFAGRKLSVTQTSTLYGGNLKFTYDIEIGKSILQKAPDRHYNVGSHHSYDGMTEYFKKGTHCGRHGHREAKITYSFGDELKLLSAKEPSTCRYEYKVQLPIADCYLSKAR